jgi:hypothetical protein
MPESAIDNESRTAIPVRQRRSRRRTVLLFGILFLVLIGPYLYSRIAASQNVVRVRNIELAEIEAAGACR